MVSTIAMTGKFNWSFSSADFCSKNTLLVKSGMLTKLSDTSLLKIILRHYRFR